MGVFWIVYTYLYVTAISPAERDDAAKEVNIVLYQHQLPNSSLHSLHLVKTI